MKTLKVYECEICHSHFVDPILCGKCEEKHLKEGYQQHTYPTIRGTCPNCGEKLGVDIEVVSVTRLIVEREDEDC